MRKIKEILFNLCYVSVIIVNTKHTNLYYIPRFKFWGKLHTRQLTPSNIKGKEFKSIIVDEVGFNGK